MRGYEPSIGVEQPVSAKYQVFHLMKARHYYYIRDCTRNGEFCKTSLYRQPDPFLYLKNAEKYVIAL